MIKSTSRLVGGLSFAVLAVVLTTPANAQQPGSKPAVQRSGQPAPKTSTAQTGNAIPSVQPPALENATPQPSIGNGPQRTTATYDDWIVQCEAQASSSPRKVCEMTQLTQLQVQGKVQPFSRIIVPQPVKGMPSALLIQVPVNVAFATKVKIQTGDSDAGMEAPFARCVPDGCFSEFSIGTESLTKLRAASAGGKLTFADSTGRAIAIPLSFNGFGRAYDALIKE